MWSFRCKYKYCQLILFKINVWTEVVKRGGGCEVMVGFGPGPALPMSNSFVVLAETDRYLNPSSTIEEKSSPTRTRVRKFSK